jgi:hypothetical protein
MERTTFVYETGDRCCEEFGFSAQTPGKNLGQTTASILSEC